MRILPSTLPSDSTVSANGPATPPLSSLSLHDALPIYAFAPAERATPPPVRSDSDVAAAAMVGPEDRKSTRLNSSHTVSPYAVYCLKKKKGRNGTHRQDEAGTSGPSQPDRRQQGVRGDE